MHEARSATANPVGIFLSEPFRSRNDETTFRGVIRHIRREIATTSGQVFGLFKGESVTTHQNLQMAILPKAHHHANPRQVVTNALTHADAVSTLVGVWGIFQIVVKAVESANKSVVRRTAGVGELPIAKVNAAVFLDSNKRALTRCRAVTSLPDLGAKLQIPKRNS